MPENSCNGKGPPAASVRQCHADTFGHPDGLPHAASPLAAGPQPCRQVKEVVCVVTTWTRAVDQDKQNTLAKIMMKVYIYRSQRT